MKTIASLLLALAALPLTAADVIVPWFGVPRAALVDTIDYAASRGDRVTVNGVPSVPTHENATASPAQTFTETDWYEIRNWLDFPVSISVPETDPETGEVIKYLNRRINRPESLFKILGEHNQSAPPRPWPGYTLAARKSCTLGTSGHVYGADCACVVCGHRRDHAFSSASGGSCARCTNRFDEYETDSLGNKSPTGRQLDTTCGATIPRDFPDGDNLAYHDGFYAEPTESEKYNCSCECGYFSVAAAPLAHDFENDALSAWRKEDRDGNVDPAQHWRFATCVRCGEARAWTAEDHQLAGKTADRTDGDSTYIDVDAHSAPGTCADCGYEGFIREAHDRDENCFCAACQAYCHDWRDAPCGNTPFVRCAYCGKWAVEKPNKDGEYITYPDPASVHSYGRPYPEGDSRRATHHSCYCGVFSKPHFFDYSDTCRLCGYTQSDTNATTHRDAVCAKLGTPNARHTGDRSRNPLKNPCPDVPEISFADVVPAVPDPYDPSATTNDVAGLCAKAYCLFSTGRVGPSVSMWIGYDPESPFTGDEVLDWMQAHLDGFTADYADSIGPNGIGSTITLNFWGNGIPRAVTNLFTGAERTEIDYCERIDFTGTFKRDRLGKVFLEWK